MMPRTCERQTEGPDEAPNQRCGRPATRTILPSLYGRTEWAACDEHAEEALRDGAEAGE